MDNTAYRISCIVLYYIEQNKYTLFSRRHNTDVTRAYYIKIYYIRFQYRKAMLHIMIKFFEIIIYNIQYFILHNRFCCKNACGDRVFCNVYAYIYIVII